MLFFQTLFIREYLQKIVSVSAKTFKQDKCLTLIVKREVS